MALKLTRFGLLFLSLTVVSWTLVEARAADRPGDPYYTITNVQTREIPASEAQNMQLWTAPPVLPAPQLDIGGVDISTIINIGQQIWNIVKANAPVASVSTSSANAVPQGITSWDQLAGWRAPQVHAFETTFTNAYGMNVVDFQYRISFIPGGSYKGEGQYLANVTVVPQNVSVAWGYKFNAQVTIPSITNAGTTRSPIGAAEVMVQWTVDTILKHDEQSAQYYLRGDGEFEAL